MRPVSVGLFIEVWARNGSFLSIAISPADSKPQVFYYICIGTVTNRRRRRLLHLQDCDEVKGEALRLFFLVFPMRGIEAFPRKISSWNRPIGSRNESTPDLFESR